MLGDFPFLKPYKNRQQKTDGSLNLSAGRVFPIDDSARVQSSISMTNPPSLTRDLDHEIMVIKITEKVTPQ